VEVLICSSMQIFGTSIAVEILKFQDDTARMVSILDNIM